MSLRSQGPRSPAGHRILLLAMMPMFTVSGCNLPSAAETTKPAEMREPAEPEMSLEEAVAVQPEDRRPTVLEEMGAPDAFTITFQELEGTVVRWEEWSYFDFDSRFDFLDGELVWTVELEPMPDGSIYAHFYDPRDFDAYMSVGAVRQLLVDQELVEIDLAEGDIPGGLILAADQILLGFDTDRLVYVETFALAPGEGPDAVALAPEPTAPTVPPTATVAATPVPVLIGPPTNTPVPGQPLPLEPAELLFEDTFQTASASAAPLFGPDVMSFAHEAGQGVMTASFQGGVLAAMYSGTLVQDFIAEFEISSDGVAPGSRVGFIFRSDDVVEGLAHYYHLALGPADGVIGIDAWKDGQWALQEAADVSGSLLPPTGTHRVRLEVQGSSMRVFLNGTFVLEVIDSQVMGAGIFGLSMISANPPETVSFDNLRIYAYP